jgi:hypothetical protein
MRSPPRQSRTAAVGLAAFRHQFRCRPLHRQRSGRDGFFCAIISPASPIST